MTSARKEEQKFNVTVTRKVTILQRQNLEVIATNKDEAIVEAVNVANLKNKWHNIRELGHDYAAEVKKTR